MPGWRSSYKQRGNLGFSLVPAIVVALSTSALAQAQQASQPTPSAASENCGPRTGIELRIGDCIRSALDAGDPRSGTGNYEEYRLRLRQGEIVQVDMEAAPIAPMSSEPDLQVPSFDTYLEIRSLAAEEPLAVNDDRLGSLNSRVVFVAPRTGVYLVRARAYAAGTGNYLLRTSRGPPPPPPLLLSPAGASGTIATMSGSPRYYFEGSQGEFVHISLQAAPSAASLRLVDQHGALIETGGGFGSDAGIVTALPRDGRYIVHIDAQSVTPPIAYNLRLARAAATEAEPPQPLQVGAEVEDDLELSSGVVDSSGHLDFFYRLYSLPMRAGRPVTLMLDAVNDSFDPMVEIGIESPLGFAAADSDDDGGAGLNSRLVVRPRVDGVLLVRVRSLWGDLGRYRLRVIDGEAPASPDL